jgi:hypothetical protein
VNDNGSRRKAPSPRRRRCINQISQDLVELIVAHGDNYRVRVTDRRRERPARCRHRRVTPGMQSDDFDVRGAEGPEQSDPNLSGADYEYALAHSLAG